MTCSRNADLFTATFKVVVGAAAIAVGAVIYGVCVVGSEATGIYECAIAAGAPWVGGALLVSSGLGEITGHHHSRRRRR